MTELSIKIKIGDREYPMKASPSEEARLRLAGKIINEKMKSYRDLFGIDDKQDLLAMVAFDSMVEKMKISETAGKQNQEVIHKINHLSSLIS
jgi:cell division protein ZapA